MFVIAAPAASTSTATGTVATGTVSVATHSSEMSVFTIYCVCAGGIEMSEVILPSKVKQASSIPVIEKDSSVFNAVWPMDTAVGSYSSMDMPSVGPVAFPTMPQRSISETNTTMDTGGSVSHSDSAADTVIVKMEPVEPELTFDAAPTTSGPGSVVDRIATAISSQLMSKSGESTGLNDGVMTTAQIVTDHSSTVSEGSGDPTVDQTSSG